MRTLFPAENAEENPQPSTWIIVGLLAVVGIGAVYFFTRPVQVSTFDPGHTYQISGAIPAGSGQYISSIVAAMQAAGPNTPTSWQNVTGVDNGNGTYTITGTFVGSSGTSVPPGTTVYRTA